MHSIIQKPFFCPRLGFASPIAESRTAHCLAIALCFFNPAELSGCSGFGHKVALGKQLSPPCRGSLAQQGPRRAGFPPAAPASTAAAARPGAVKGAETSACEPPTRCLTLRAGTTSLRALPAFRCAASPAAPQPGHQSHRFLPGLSSHTLRDLPCPPGPRASTPPPATARCLPAAAALLPSRLRLMMRHPPGTRLPTRDTRPLYLTEVPLHL